MPTGYTADVQSGKVTEFPDFAMQCARAFGALIMMRDDPHDAPIPDKFEPSSYHDKELELATFRLAQLRAMSADAIVRAATSAEDKREREEAGREQERQQQRARYQAMLEKVNAWEPPTPDHEGMKQFMVEQLTGSIDFDTKPYKPEPRLTPAEWYAREISSAEWKINYHTEEAQKEHERAAERTEWVRQLRESLKNQ